MSARVTRQACLQSGATHREHPGEIPHSPSGVPRHLPKRPRRVESITFQVQLRQAQTTAETAEPHAPECAPRHAALLALAAGGSAPLSPSPADLSWQDADDSLSRHAALCVDPQAETPGLGFAVPH